VRAGPLGETCPRPAPPELMSGGASGRPAATGQSADLTRHESRSRVGVEPVRRALKSAVLVVLTWLMFVG